MDWLYVNDLRAAAKLSPTIAHAKDALYARPAARWGSKKQAATTQQRIAAAYKWKQNARQRLQPKPAGP